MAENLIAIWFNDRVEVWKDGFLRRYYFVQGDPTVTLRNYGYRRSSEWEPIEGAQECKLVRIGPVPLRGSVP